MGPGKRNKELTASWHILTPQVFVVHLLGAIVRVGSGAGGQRPPVTAGEGDGRGWEGQMHDLCRGAVSVGCSEKVSDKVTCG